MATDLMKIQEAQTSVELLPLPSMTLLELQKGAKEQTAILSTRMEGTTLSESEARRAAYESRSTIEEQEVYNLMVALQKIEEWEHKNAPITEERIQELHALIHVITGGGVLSEVIIAASRIRLVVETSPGTICRRNGTLFPNSWKSLLRGLTRPTRTN